MTEDRGAIGSALGAAVVSANPACFTCVHNIFALSEQHDVALMPS